MSRKILTDIINLCLRLDQKSRDVYAKLAATERKKKVQDFWIKMSAEEMQHVNYLEELFALAEQGSIPPLFEDPPQIKQELEALDIKTNRLIKELESKPDSTNNFLMAYNLELYLLHPAFVELFHFMKTLPGREAVADYYENHINNFIDALDKSGEATPELLLMGSIIKRLWYDNKLLTVKNTTDPLTNILNRGTLFSSIGVLAQLAKRNGNNIGMFMIDIDHFKNVNDTYGHRRGDQILKQVANTIKKSIRTSDVIGRYGGEEFLVFLPQVESSALLNIAEKIRNSVEIKTKNNLPVTISLGASTGVIKTNVKRELETLIKKADEALYQAKSSGRNKTVLSSE